MPTLLLQLKGPLQSWATEDGYTHRNTGSLPTKSGVIGLVASALGRARGSDISDLAALRFGVQPVHTGPRLTDFQTMGKRADGKPNPLETKEYLQDSTFTVGLESTDLRLLIRIGAAIQHPVYMPYLGRRACPPAGPIRVGLVDKPLEQAFKGKERIHVETVDGVEAHWDQPANNRVFQARYSNAIDPLFNAVAEAQKKAEAMSDFTPADLPRVSERIPYLYLEQCVIKRANNALVAADENGETALPIATIAVLMLGPGTTITHDAVVLASDTGAIIVWAGEQGVRHYCSGSALTGSTRLLEQQARLVSNERSRLMVARRMYAMRFPGEDLSHTTMRQLLGMEGTRVAALYTAEAKRNDIQWHGRKWDDRGGAVNIALSTANSCLYGVVHAAITALGCSPALGFVHCHNRRSFLFDIADLYKAEYSIPLAFRLHACTPSLVDGIARRRMRDMMQDGRLLERCVHDVSTLLSEEPDNEDNCSVWTGGQRYGKAGQSWAPS